MDHILNYYCHLFTNLNIFKVKIELCEKHVKIKHHAFRKIEFGCCFQQFYTLDRRSTYLNFFNYRQHE